MNRLKSLTSGIIAVVAVVMAAGCATPKQATGPTYRGAPQDVKEFEVNGLKVILRPIGSTNHVIAAKLFIKGGVTALPENMSPAVEDLALQVPPLSGPADMSKSEYRRLIDRMVTGIIPGAGRDFSVMTLRCIDEKFDSSWALFTGVIMRPKYDPVELANTKDRMITGLRNRFALPESYATYLADSSFFHNHPYGRIAHEEDIPPITAGMLENYYRNLFVKSRLLLVVVGNVDSADLHQKIAGSLALLPQGNYTPAEVPVPENANSPQLIIRPPVGGKDIPTNYIVARYLAPDQGDSLYYPMLRLTSFLRGSLFREIRIERNLSYAPDADVNFGKTSFGEISISTTLPDSAWRTAKREVIDFFRLYVIRDEYMKSGLSSWITSNYMNEQSNESQANDMGKAEIYTGSWTNAFNTIEAISSMTPEEMNLAAQLYMRNFTIAIVGDPSKVDTSVFLPQSTRKRNSSTTPEESLKPNNGDGASVVPNNAE
jgi:predicted Zn-dependent peptidase